MFVIMYIVQTNNQGEQLLRTVDSVGDSLRRSVERGTNISHEPIVKEHIVVQVKRVTDQKSIRFPDNFSTTGQNDWIAKTESHLIISSDDFTGLPFLRLYCVVNVSLNVF